MSISLHSSRSSRSSNRRKLSSGTPCPRAGSRWTTGIFFNSGVCSLLTSFGRPSTSSARASFLWRRGRCRFRLVCPNGPSRICWPKMETDRVEIKSSAYYSYKPDIPEKVITESVLKTVAGFFNSGGGTLVVGIADDGEILGIQPDLDQKNMDRDRYVNSLTTAIERSLGPLASTMSKIQLQAVDGIQVALVHVAPSPEPIYAKVSKGDQVFFIRVNNSTRVLKGPDLVGYVKQRWA